jgi:hypothetical protein
VDVEYAGNMFSIMGMFGALAGPGEELRRLGCVAKVT